MRIAFIDILDDEGTVNLDDRAAAWRKEGWDGRYAPDQHLGTTGVTGTRNIGTGPLDAPTTAAKPRPTNSRILRAAAFKPERSGLRRVRVGRVAELADGSLSRVNNCLSTRLRARR